MSVSVGLGTQADVFLEEQAATSTFNVKSLFCGEMGMVRQGMEWWQVGQHHLSWAYDWTRMFSLMRERSIYMLQTVSNPGWRCNTKSFLTHVVNFRKILIWEYLGNFQDG